MNSSHKPHHVLQKDHPHLRGYNDLPENFTAIDEDEFWAHFDDNYSNYHEEGGKYLCRDDFKNTPFYNKHVRFWVSTLTGIIFGYAQEAVYNEELRRYDRRPKHFFKAYKCEHKVMNEDPNYNGGKFMHKYVCQASGCNFSYVVDSSD